MPLTWGHEPLLQQDYPEGVSAGFPLSNLLLEQALLCPIALLAQFPLPDCSSLRGSGQCEEYTGQWAAHLLMVVPQASRNVENFGGTIAKRAEEPFPLLAQQIPSLIEQGVLSGL